MQRYTVVNYTVAMKTLLLLSLLLLSARTGKAQEVDAKYAYYFGIITGAGLIQCAAVKAGKLNKDFAQESLNYLVKRLSSDPKSSDVADSMKEAYQALKQEAECKGVY